MVTVPVIAIDGPAASGKGAVAEAVARQLGFHYLDSGVMYRAVAFAAGRQGLALDDAERVAKLAKTMALRFCGGRIWLGDEDVSAAVRSEACGRDASRVAALPAVRQALLETQRAYRRMPGLVADGRDMGSMVFPDATLKIFLTAAAEVRAQRRHKQLMGKGIDASIADLLQEIRRRDVRDSERAVAPLRQGADAILLDTTQLTISEAVAEILGRFSERCRA